MQLTGYSDFMILCGNCILTQLLASFQGNQHHVTSRGH